MQHATLSEAGLGRREDRQHHHDPCTGFLSIDVINILGASLLGLHVEGDAVPLPTLRAEPEGAALVNWNGRHWTVLQREAESGAWRHTNSIVGKSARHGRCACSSAAELENILAEIHAEAGGVTLHRICSAAVGVGTQFL